ncbi:hypothetical protein [Frigoriglobus tundricola]|uniref:Uncharacterized protein n=1 Tax=Frigoriglobus tundricola TaxID=2774151 RepID=A0A6M5YMP7_9BACT|nr:hypothetical protein [Frigoriglobus tundricola]QJW95337.1 hypothetical protein FTUN_2885 [Frigoriglobus tundricola]
MPVRPTTHFTWQVLRTVKRSTTPPTGRTLRIAPTVSTKDGAFLTVLVEEGLLKRVTGTADAPFEATYALTALGEHAAEYGEYEYRVRSAPVAEPVPVKKVKKK